MTYPTNGSRWRHHKHGLVQIVCTATHIGQSSPVVIFRSVETDTYGESGTLSLPQFLGNFTPVLEMPMAA